MARKSSTERGGLTNREIATAGVAAGVGSAALVAALLYAGRPKAQKISTPAAPKRPAEAEDA